MYMTIMSFIVTAVMFFVLHFFIDSIGAYYVPTSLFVLSLWLKIIQREWNADKFITATAKMEPSAAAGHLSIIAILYSIICLIFSFWIPLAICALVFVLSLRMKFPHSY